MKACSSITGSVRRGPARPIRTLEDLAAYLACLRDGTLLVDDTKISRWSPQAWEEQKAAWSGKAKDHVVKATVLSDRGRRAIWVEANPSGEGRTGDIAMLRSQQGLLPALQAGVAAGTVVLADRGYPTLIQDLGGQGVITPVYANRYHPISDHDRMFNRALSSTRMPVEHALGRMKRLRALTYRRRPVPPSAALYEPSASSPP
ncbi:MAG: transposase [Acidimicrobiia bacterium]|nr:transposase [Acidimicrobiia bacterium]